MAAVLPYLTANDGLRRLSLAQNEIDSESVGMVCLALVPKQRTAWLESVQYLDLGMNMIRDEGAKLVSCNSSTKRTTLRGGGQHRSARLNALGGTGVETGGPRSPSEWCAPPPEFGRYTSRLTFWLRTISHNCVQVISLRQPVRVLAETGRSAPLCQHAVPGNDIGAMGCVELAQSLHANTSLRSLNIATNRADVQGATAFAAAIASNSSLTSLNLTSNQLCGVDPYQRGSLDLDGIMKIVSALDHNSTLTDVSLDLNRIHGSALDAFKAACERLSSRTGY